MTFILACPTCAQAMKDAGGNAAGYSILFLLVVILTVLGTVAICFFRIARRERRSFDPTYSDANIPNSKIQ